MDVRKDAKETVDAIARMAKKQFASHADAMLILSKMALWIVGLEKKTQNGKLGEVAQKNSNRGIAGERGWERVDRFREKNKSREQELGIMLYPARTRP